MNHFAKLPKASIGHMLEKRSVKDPVVQLVAYKNIIKPDGSNRYRLILSDGIYLHHCCIVMIDELKEKILNQEIDRFCLLKINSYVLNEIHNQFVIVITDVELIVRGSEVNQKLGSPVVYGSADTVIAAKYPVNYHLVEREMEKEFSDDDVFWSNLSDQDLNNNNRNINDLENPVKRLKTFSSSIPSAPLYQSSVNHQQIVPISSLHQFSYHWVISGRVVTKSDVKSWSNVRGSGVLFSFELQDYSSLIKIVAFGNQCYEYAEMIQFGECYLVSKGKVKVADKRYTTNQYEINCTDDTKIEPYANNNLPVLRYQFVDFNAIQHKPSNSVVDVTGILLEIEDLSTYVRRRDQSEGEKRNIQLIDQTQNQILVCLWDSYGTNFDAKLGDIVIIRKACVNDFNGLSLNTSFDSTLLINPTIHEAHQLRSWHNELDDRSLNIKKLSNKPASMTVECGTLSKITLNNARQPNQPLLLVKCTIMGLNRASAYKACEKCSKKLIELEGILRCEKCGTETVHFDWKLMAQLCLEDHTNSVYATAFHDTFIKLLKDSDLNRLGNLFESDFEAFNDEMIKCVFKSFKFKLRSGIDNFTGSERLKIQVSGVDSINLIEFGRKLLEEIKTF